MNKQTIYGSGFILSNVCFMFETRKIYSQLIKSSASPEIQRHALFCKIMIVAGKAECSMHNGF